LTAGSFTASLASGFPDLRRFFVFEIPSIVACLSVVVLRLIARGERE
jgi:hypothetical protein